MTTFLVAWALAMVLACFVITGVIVVVAVREHVRSQVGRPVSSSTRLPVPAPRIPEQRASSAAAVVVVRDTEAFDEFLRELIVTPHVEEALR